MEPEAAGCAVQAIRSSPAGSVRVLLPASDAAPSTSFCFACGRLLVVIALMCGVSRDVTCFHCIGPACSLRHLGSDYRTLPLATAWPPGRCPM